MLFVGLFSHGWRGIPLCTIAPDTVVWSAAFGYWKEGTFIASSEVPLVPKLRYGWQLDVESRRPVRYNEIFVVDRRPPFWKVNPKRGRLSEDGMRHEKWGNGTANIWRVRPDDPPCRGEIQVFISGVLVVRFIVRFRLPTRLETKAWKRTRLLH